MENVILWTALIVIGSFALPAILFAPWVPTWRRDFARIVQLANLTAGERFIDLGSGAGGLVLYIARETTAQAIGIELAPIVLGISRLRAFFQRSSARFEFGNFLKRDLSDIDVIYMFGTPKGLTEALKQKISQEAKPSVRIISYVFPIPGWEAITISHTGDKSLPIHLYKKPKAK